MLAEGTATFISQTTVHSIGISGIAGFDWRWNEQLARGSVVLVGMLPEVSFVSPLLRVT